MNPTGQPMGMPAPSAPSGSAKDALNVPSLLIMILSALGALTALSLLAGGPAMVRALVGLVPNMPADQKQQMLEAASQRNLANMAPTMFVVVLCGLTFFGALQMRSLKNFGLAMASAILVMVPCGSYWCCCLGLPIGIWALVTMNKPEVKSAFT
jgi:hypothetical protein